MAGNKFSPGERTPHRAERKCCRQRPRSARLGGRLLGAATLGATLRADSAALGLAGVHTLERVVILVGLACVLGVSTLREKALAAMRTATAQGRAAILGLHPGTKAMLADARALRTL